ncbi:MAG TPA: LLM class flavin-dependent oxidoreductase [Actinospica sp.]|nr:LLM class flavin-dependent oxidoreductase [Actinospica sp.]
MKFGYFTHVWGDPGLTPGQRYARLWDEIETADRLGFDYAFSVEHHFTPHESWMASPAVFCTGAALRTERIRVGALGWVPPLHHPLHLVEDIATLDHLLGGRLEVGLASGVSPEPFVPFGADFAGRKALTKECADLIRAAFAVDGPFDFTGPVHELREVTLSHGAVQRPHPPIWIPTSDRHTLRYLAEIGGHTASTMIVPRAALAPVYRRFVDWWRGHGHEGAPNIGYWSLVHVAETDAKAEAQAAEHVARTFSETLRYDKVSRSAPQAAPASTLGTAQILEHSADLGFLLDHNLVFVGSPQTVAHRIKEAAQEGVFNTLFGEFAFGRLGEREWGESMRLFAGEVAPLLADFSVY